MVYGLLNYLTRGFYKALRPEKPTPVAQPKPDSTRETDGWILFVNKKKIISIHTLYKA